MLVLKLNKARESRNKNNSVFRRRKIIEKKAELNRFSMNVNEKAVLVLELNENQLLNDDVITLLKIYKGRVLVANENKDNGILKEYLFSPKEYYKRAILSSFINQIKIVNREWKNISVKTDVFFPYKELFEIVKISKKVNLVTQKNAKTIKFVKDCYNEYGAIVSLNNSTSSEDDVVLDLEEIDSGGKLMISTKEKCFLLYPDTTYFKMSEEYKKLVPFGIEHNLICAAFSNK